MTSEVSPVRVVGLVPAAGLSRRMGAAKQTLPYQGSTITGAVARSLLGAELDAVVLVTRAELLENIGLPEDPRLQVAINDEPDNQMMDSILLGLQKIDEVWRDSPNEPQAIGVLVVPGDMPTVSSTVCRACAEVFMKDPTRIVIATYGGKRGHPIVFPLSLRSGLKGVSTGLNQLPRSHPDLVCEVDAQSPSILRDVDTPADYDRLSS